MTTWMILLALFLLAGPAAVQAADTKASPPTTDATGATFTVTWTGGSAAWEAGYGDGSAKQKGTGTSPLTLKMPYHASGAAFGGFVGVLGSFAPLPVPARGGPPPETTTHSLLYTEPKTNQDGTPLNDLASVRAYYRVDGGAEATVSYPASGLTGGAARSQNLVVPATVGTLTVAVAAVDTGGSESARSTVASKVIGVPPPPPPPPQQFELKVTATAGGVASGTGSYPAGTMVSPKEAAATGFVFAGWSGACSGAGACSVTMDSDKSVMATFAAVPPPPPPPADCNQAGIAMTVPVPVGGKTVMYSGMLRCAP